jgi:hypothetical protein
LIGAALVASTVAGRGEAFAQPHSESKASGFSKDVSPDNHILANASPLQRAERHLQEALSRDRKIGLVELEAAILLEFAKLRFVETRQQTTDDRKNVLMQESFDFAHEALAIAERCEYRLDQADIHGFLAEWWLAETGSGKQSSVVGQRSSVAEALAEARKHAERAKERASCDGVPYHYKVAYERAERLLKSLEARQ